MAIALAERSAILFLELCPYARCGSGEIQEELIGAFDPGSHVFTLTIRRGVRCS